MTQRSLEDLSGKLMIFIKYTRMLQNRKQEQIVFFGRKEQIVINNQVPLSQIWLILIEAIMTIFK